MLYANYWVYKLKKKTKTAVICPQGTVTKGESLYREIGTRLVLSGSIDY